MQSTRIRHTVRLPKDLSGRMADLAKRQRISQAMVMHAALESFLSPDGSERMEAAVSRRIDKITRQLDKLDYRVEVGNEAAPSRDERCVAETRSPGSDRASHPDPLSRACARDRRRTARFRRA